MFPSLLVFFAFAASPAIPMPPVQYPLLARATYSEPAPHLSATSWLWNRGPRNPRLLLPNRQYYQSHVYDPRLRLDYPWHKPRVRTPICPPFPVDMPNTAYEF